MSTNEISPILKHAIVQIDSELRMHYVTAGAGKQTVVLLHGFPQTWRAWSTVIPLLVSRGFRIIAPDYRGAGDSSRPFAGYDKRSMAVDVHTLVRNHLGIEVPITIVGHDIGLMVGYAYAEQFREEVSHLVVVDAPLPGTAVFEEVRTNPRVWHFAFHGTRDIPEMLVSGKERQYLQAFFQARAFNPPAIDDQLLNLYASAYSAPGAMRAGFELYRAFDQDAEQNRRAVANNGKLSIPVLAVFGAISNTGPRIRSMMEEVATNVMAFCVPRTAHWVPEENPDDFVRVLVAFLAGATDLDLALLNGG